MGNKNFAIYIKTDTDKSKMIDISKLVAEGKVPELLTPGFNEEENITKSAIIVPLTYKKYYNFSVFNGLKNKEARELITKEIEELKEYESHEINNMDYISLENVYVILLSINAILEEFPKTKVVVKYDKQVQTTNSAKLYPEIVMKSKKEVNDYIKEHSQEEYDKFMEKLNKNPNDLIIEAAKECRIIRNECVLKYRELDGASIEELEKYISEYTIEPFKDIYQYEKGKIVGINNKTLIKLLKYKTYERINSLGFLQSFEKNSKDANKNIDFSFKYISNTQAHNVIYETQIREKDFLNDYATYSRNLSGYKKLNIPIYKNIYKLYYDEDKQGYYLRTSMLKDYDIIFRVEPGMTRNDKPNNVLDIISKVVNNELVSTASQLYYNNTKKYKGFTLNLGYEIIPEDGSELNPDRILGIDLGVNQIASWAVMEKREVYDEKTGEVYNEMAPIPKYEDSISQSYSKHIIDTKVNLQKRKDKLKSDAKYTRGGKGRKKKLYSVNKIGNKELNQSKNNNHNISKMLVNAAISAGCGTIHMEQLDSDELKKTKFLRRNWTYAQLQTFIEYKASRAGIKVKYIDPNYTSQQCHYCGHFSVNLNNDELFFGRDEKDKTIYKCGNPECEMYNKEINADINAAYNIAANPYILKEADKYLSDTKKKELGIPGSLLSKEVRNKLKKIENTEERKIERTKALQRSIKTFCRKNKVDITYDADDSGKLYKMCYKDGKNIIIKRNNNNTISRIGYIDRKDFNVMSELTYNLLKNNITEKDILVG